MGDRGDRKKNKKKKRSASSSSAERSREREKRRRTQQQQYINSNRKSSVEGGGSGLATTGQSMFWDGCHVLTQVRAAMTSTLPGRIGASIWATCRTTWGSRRILSQNSFMRQCATAACATTPIRIPSCMSGLHANKVPTMASVNFHQSRRRRGLCSWMECWCLVSCVHQAAQRCRQPHGHDWGHTGGHARRCCPWTGPYSGLASYPGQCHQPDHQD